MPHGTLTRHVYHSTVLNGEREMYVYTPPGYDRAKTYPVLPAGWERRARVRGTVADGQATFITDNLIAEGKAVPMIIAMPNNQVVHRNDPKHTALTFDLFARELRTQIHPARRGAVPPFRNDRRARAIAGLSMGGRHTQLVGFKALDLFASFGVLSAGDPASETSTPEFLNDRDINTKVDYLLVGLGPHNQPANRSVVCSPDPREAWCEARLRHRRQRRPRLGDVALPAAREPAAEPVQGRQVGGAARDAAQPPGEDAASARRHPGAARKRVEGTRHANESCVCHRSARHCTRRLCRERVRAGTCAACGAARREDAGRTCRPARGVAHEIHADRTVTFRLLAPKATTVVLNGNWDSGTNIAMAKDDQGIWSVTVGPLGEQLWGYSFNVDGVKVDDPGNGESQRDGQRYDNLVMIAGPASDAWTFRPDVPHGTR